MFLKILGKRSHKNSQKCKDAFNAIAFKGKETLIEKSILEKLIPKEILEEKRKEIQPLNRLIRCLEGDITKVMEEDDNLTKQK
ncbi:hypothetical protein GNZ06_05355 [Aeromonas jandaei]|uniref:hypothetical protein n=1 Tax=Aeromonas jandaei TaxID=650 RepID=UPI0019316967|nr:hypothetical protein [Aeromonas jandaei]MBM0491242.1 hypothetical protein [Aeromonas jandaei]MBM0568224.1 hypothetical protein [Aeromonas jandaei]